MEIKRIGVLSAAKIVGGLYAGIGLLVGLIFACFGLLGLVGVLAEADADLFGVSSAFMLVGLCAMPIFYGLLGVIAGTIGAVLYNLIAGAIGGLEIELAQTK